MRKQSFKTSQMDQSSQREAFKPTSTLADLAFWYYIGSIRVYKYIIKMIIKDLGDQFTIFNKMHFVILGAFCSVILACCLIGILVVRSKVHSMQAEVKETYRLVPSSTFIKNKYLRNYLIQTSPVTVSQHTTKIFN